MECAGIAIFPGKDPVILFMTLLLPWWALKWVSLHPLSKRYKGVIAEILEASGRFRTWTLVIACRASYVAQREVVSLFIHLL